MPRYPPAINGFENTVRGKDAIIVGGQLGQIAGIDTLENAGQETGTLIVLAVAGGAGIQELGGSALKPPVSCAKEAVPTVVATMDAQIPSASRDIIACFILSS